MRQAAEQELQEMGPTGRDLLVGVMRYEEQQRKETRKLRATDILVNLSIFGAGCLTFWLIRGRLVFFPWIGNLIGSFVLFLVYAVWISRAQNNAAYLLAKHFEDTSIIGPLAEALEYRDKAVRKAAAEALTRLLPRLQETDDSLLTGEQRNCLHHALMDSEPALVLAVMIGLRRVGDARAIPNVQKLAAGQGVAATDELLQEAAQETLRILRHRVEAQRAPQVLLRASSSPMARADELLRPAADRGIAEGQERVLLRATSRPDEEAL
jgi:hypothetical protein